MTDYLTGHFMPHVRLAILRCLAEAPGCAANASLLKSVLQQLGLPATRDQVHTAVAWLAEQGLVVRTEPLGVVVATLTEAGEDVARGRSRVDGVARPSPGV